MYTLEDIFKDSLVDGYSVCLDSPKMRARLVWGVKICQDRESGEIEILNTTRSGDYYEEITKEEYKVFAKKGWREGVYNVSLSNYRRKLKLIEGRIKLELNGRKSSVNIDSLKISRERLMNRYSTVTKKLHKLNQTQ